MAEGNFECKVHARRETKEGAFITLLLNPADMTADLAMLRVGSSLVIGWAEIVDASVQPIELGQEPGRHPVPTPNGEREGLDSAPTKDRRKFSDLPLSQQAAIRCQDADYQHWFGCSNAEDTAQKIRNFCGVLSRAEIMRGEKSGQEWMELESRYQAYLTDRMYGDARHG